MARVSGISLRVHLLGMPEPVYRDLWVPLRYTWHQLHLVIQTAFGWENLHRYEFRYGAARWGLPRSPDVSLLKDARSVRLSAVAWHPQTGFDYWYNLQEGWHHRLIVLDCSTGSERRPRLIDGQGVCPPEDVGGPAGYREFLAAIQNPAHEDHDLYRLWADGHYAFDGFCLEETAARLQKAFMPRRRKKPTTRRLADISVATSSS